MHVQNVKLKKIRQHILPNSVWDLSSSPAILYYKLEFLCIVGSADGVNKSGAVRRTAADLS